MNGNINNILFPTDFSEVANNALPVAIAMTKRQNATLHILHVIVPQYQTIVGDTAFTITTAANINEEIENIYRGNLEELATKIKSEYQIDVKIYTVSGYVSESIVKFAENKNIDIITMGTHGISGVREFFLGSNAYSVLKDACCPVLTIPNSSKKVVFENVLFPIRNVEGVLEKYKSITQILKANSSKVELLGVAHFNDFTSFESIFEKILEVKTKMEEENVEVIQRNEFCENIADFILEYAAESKTDLLVINATIDSDWKRFFMGSYAQKIVNHALCPVLSIKPKLAKIDFEKAIKSRIEDAKNIFNHGVFFPQIANLA